MKFVLFIAIALVATLLALVWLQRGDRRAVAALRESLSSLADTEAPRFRPAMVADLPEPARRYLTWAIMPGTRLARVAEIEMRGSFGLGDADDPKYQPMTARQVLALPGGFVWEMRTTGGLPISGSDAGGAALSWTRFAIAGLIPVARAGWTEDHRRSAFGRAVAEAAIWTPAAVLPRPGVRWEAPSPDVARVTVEAEGLVQSVDLTLSPEGAPLSFVLQRWSNANPAKVWQLQPFGGPLSDHRLVSGYRIPFHNEAGNFFGEEGYFPFFVADLTSVRYLPD
ncbi:DUF6544 family protein [Oceanicola sp. 22II-s10i]|uniref:DUF6544 family protein n=1 Tax=Oceanicola sp. 22II-s10i TaxID=1317116 RepID=UPI0020CF9E32|nr:DUF6544 family protein [Oceanicola sp. 22II-s10i]